MADKQKLSEEEVLEKFGDIKLRFSEYFKYSFIYSTIINDTKCILYNFGNGDDIYRASLYEEMTIRQLYQELNISYFEYGKFYFEGEY